MAAGEIRAGKAFVELFVKGDIKGALNKVVADLKAFGGSVVEIGASLGAAGAAISAPLMFAIHEFRGAGTELLDLSTISGVSAQRLGELQQAAVGLGGSAQMVSNGIRGVGNFMVALAQGSPDALRALSMLRVSFNELQRMSPDRQFQALAAGLQNVGNSAQRAQLQQQIFADGSGAMMRLLAHSSDEWARATEQARRSGAVMSGEDVAAANALNVAWNSMTAAVGALWQKIGAALAPSFTTLLGLLTDGVLWLTRWVDENRGLVRIIDITGTALTVAGAALTGLGGVFFVESGVAGGLATVVGFLGTAFAGLLGFLGAAATGAVGFVAALVPMLPLIAIVGVGLAALALQAGIVLAVWGAAGAAIYYFWDEIVAVASKAADAVVAAWDYVNDAQRAAWNAISDVAGAALDKVKGVWGPVVAFFGGLWNRLAADASAAWNAISSTVADVVGQIGELFGSMGEVFGETWGGIVEAVSAGNLMDAFNIAMAGLGVVWVQGTNFLREKWTEFTNWIADTFETEFATIVGGLRIMWNQAVGFMARQLAGLLDYLPAPLRRFLVGNVSSADLVAQINADTEAANRRVGAQVAADIDPNRESARRRREGLEGVRAEGREREQGARAGLAGALETAEGHRIAAETDRIREELMRQFAEAHGAGRQLPAIGWLAEVRGTFSGAALAGVGGAGNNPVVNAVEEQTNVLRQVQEAIADIGERFAGGLNLGVG